MKTTPPTQQLAVASDEQLWTIAEICAYVKVTPKHVRAMFANGLPYVTTNAGLTGRKRVRKADLDAFLAGELSHPTAA